jgi:hypothetical protein
MHDVASAVTLRVMFRSDPIHRTVAGEVRLFLAVNVAHAVVALSALTLWAVVIEHARRLRRRRPAAT